MKQIKIRIAARSKYLPDQSSPQGHRFLWEYEITITNQSDEIVQLLNRHWRITDMTGKMEEVKGPGVVGLQPVIKPGKEFIYSSFCQIATPQGAMEGYYEIQTLNDEMRYMVDIPKFALTSPAEVATEFRSRLH